MVYIAYPFYKMQGCILWVHCENDILWLSPDFSNIKDALWKKSLDNSSLTQLLCSQKSIFMTISAEVRETKALGCIHVKKEERFGKGVKQVEEKG